MTAVMPRGGPDASWLDRRYQTDEPEYLDRPDTPHEAARVRRALHRMQLLTRGYDRYARWTLERAGAAPSPRVLELGAGTGGLSRRVLHRHPGARVTVSDVAPDAVAALEAGQLGAHPRAAVRRLDATAIDAPDAAFDVAVFAASLHHLPPDGVRAVLREGTRVATTLLLIDAWRSPWVCAAAVPLMFATGGADPCARRGDQPAQGVRRGGPARAGRAAPADGPLRVPRLPGGHGGPRRVRALPHPGAGTAPPAVPVRVAAGGRSLTGRG
ncbi:class I SAM-dependent methyltransferase [Streptomyces sp. JH002]|uniref:class I SAM-dependent methyltransferase n=1 Tax=Streptomyces sp. JH002 TaxID=2763259 RepID=UPI003D80281E